MKFNSSNSIDDEYWQSDDHYIVLDEDKKTIRLQKYRVRYSPVDDYMELMDVEIPISELIKREDLQELVNEWFGETTQRTIRRKIADIS